MLPTPGRPVPGICCPACKCGVLYYSLATTGLWCRACPWAVFLLPAEAAEMARALAGIAAIPTLVERIGRRVAVVEAPPEQGLFYEVDGQGAGKWRIVPRGPEPDGGMARLTEQGVTLNEIGVRPLNREHTEFEVQSQRRFPDGTRPPPYSVRISAWTARCSCKATKPCAHLTAARKWLEERCEQRAARKDRAQIEADGDAARELLWG